ncbi:MAG: FAD binding domain-containing protein [Methylotenera sp.]|nr:FAD binding domain-containing protein [Oligoflexia bacterium]
MLSDYLRYERGLVGTKVVCAEGDCGACSVLRLRPMASSKNLPQAARNIYLPINSCITTVAQMDGSSLVTVEALASQTAGLTPVQQAMVSSHGSQCGFCTPGFVMALTGLVEKKLCDGVKKGARCTPREAKNCLTGNLCRCTGYQPIIDAAVAIDLSKCASVKDQFYSLAQERELKKVLKDPVKFQNEHFSFFAPTTLKDAAAFLRRQPDARLIGAATDLGVVHNKGKIRLSKLLSLHLIPELYDVKKLSPTRMTVGSRVTLSELRHFLKDKIPEFAKFLDLFASPQIKNLATLSGNVSNGSPIADTPPFLLIAQATIIVAGPRGKRSIPIEKFYLGYRKTALKPGEFISAIEFDLPKKTESLALYKVSQRKDLDISGVNAAFRITWSDAKKTKIREVRIALGGVGPTTLRLPRTEAALKGLTLKSDPNSMRLNEVVEILHSEMQPLSDLRGTSAFRRVLVENLFLKFFREQGVLQ